MIKSGNHCPCLIHSGFYTIWNCNDKERAEASDSSSDYIEWRCFLDSLELAHLLVDTILDKKGSNITLLDIREHALFASYFLLCNGENIRQLQTLVNSIAADAKQKGAVLPLGVEGEAQNGWLLVDFGDLIVHVFAPEKRAYYNLEELWSEAHTVLEMQ